MKVSQHDMRTARIDTGEARVLLRYDLRFDEMDRQPESITVEDNQITAFFLTGTISDMIVPRKWGFTVKRTWLVRKRGNVRLAIALRVPAGRADRVLLPGVACVSMGALQPLGVLGERCSLPSGALISGSDRSLCFFTDAPLTSEEETSVSVAAYDGDDGAGISLFVFRPPEETPGRAVGTYHVHDGSRPPLEVTDRLDAQMHLHVAVGPAVRAYEAAMEVCLAPVGGTTPSPPGLQESERQEDLVQSGLDALLSTHLEQDGPVCGLRITPAAQPSPPPPGPGWPPFFCSCVPMTRRVWRRRGGWRTSVCGPSIRAGCSTSFLTRRGSGGEVSDPRGPAGVGFAGAALPPASGFPEQACTTASALFRVAEGLERIDVPGGEYAAAARRFVNAFVDRRGRLRKLGAVVVPDLSLVVEEGLGILAFADPLTGMLEQEPGDRYRKACVALRDDMLGGPWPFCRLPCSRRGREPDSKAPLLLLQGALDLADAGIPVTNLGDIAAHLLPWVYANGSFAQGPGSLAGALVDGFDRSRLLLKGRQTAYLCRRVAGVTRRPRARALYREVAARALECSAAFPLGTSYYTHTYWSAAPPRPRSGEEPDRADAVGVVDARVFCSEALYGLKLVPCREGRD